MNMTPDQMKAYFRKPELKISLPSQGRYYPQGSLVLDQTGEVDVYPMTAVDELTLKTPDALLTGEGTVKVIHSCVPAIKNAWMMPASDVDVVLIAIRIATYGNKMTVTSKVPKTGTSVDNEVDLQMIFDRVVKDQVSNSLLLDNGLKVFVRPNNYQQLSLIRKTTFEKQRLARTINDAEIDDKNKQEQFNKIFAELTKINVESLVNNIEAIETPEGAISDRNDINEFVNNVDLKFVEAIRKKVTALADLGTVPPITVQSPEEDVEKGAPETYTIPIMFDNSDFFAFSS